MVDLKDYSKAQAERLAYIDFRLYFLGFIFRFDLMDRFGLASAAATRDFALYRELAPDNTELNQATKSYVIKEGFTPIVEHIPERVLITLSQGFGDGVGEGKGPLIPHESVSLLGSPSVDILASITRAISTSKVVKIAYYSGSGESVREIIPFAIGCDGLRWHTRAYDRKRKKFVDFVLTRMSSAEILEHDSPRSEEQKDFDDQWNRMVELELVPHPDQDSEELVKRDYGMKDGSLRLKVRAAMAGYVLQQYHVDCSADHSIRDKAYRLWLKDSLTLYGVESAHFAPGYSVPSLK